MEKATHNIIYLFKADTQQGPFTEEAVRAGLADGTFRDDDLAWEDGMEDWKPLSVFLEEGVPLVAPVEPMPEPPQPTVYAGFLRRFAAVILDLPFWNAPLLFQTITTGRWPSIERFNGVWVFWIWLYFAAMESQHGATFGKMLLGIHVKDLQGKLPSLKRATVRHFGHWLSILPLMTGFLLALVTPRKQTLHDLLAGCVVIQGKKLRPWL